MSSVGEDLAANLRNYKIQLQQVEAALTSEPDNEEFLKLKEDLEEVITLTKTLMNDEGTPIDTDQDKDLISHSSEIRHNYRSGDIVLAPWSQDGQFYEAEIEDIVSDGQCNVTFKGSAFGRGRVSEVCLINLLKPLPGTSRKKLKLDTSGKQFDSAPSTQINTKQKRIQLQQHREYLKRKQQKKQSRLRDLEEEREKEKNKWKQFNVKAVNRHLKGATTLAKKQSIFKSPDTVEGKVGVGTCGIAGKPMTNFVVADKYKRGTSTAAPSSSGSSASRNPNLHSISNIR